MMGTFTLAQSKNSVSIFIYPNGDLAGCIDFTPVGDSDNYKCIDEAKNIPDGDTTHVMWNNASTGIDMYSLPNDTDFTGTINYVQVFARAKSYPINQSPSGIFKIICSPNSDCGTLFKSNNIDLITGYRSHTKIWTKNPLTTIDWTLNDIRNLSIGIETSSPTLIDKELIQRLNPNSDGDINNWGHIGCWALHYKNVADPGTNCNIWDITPSERNELFNFQGTEITGTTGTIDYIKVFALITRSHWTYTRNARFTHKDYGTTENADWFLLLPGSPYLVNHTWTTQATGAAWTWAALDQVQFGMDLSDSGIEISMYEYYIAVYYHTNINPEIRTTQCFAKVNYTPPSDSCTLNKPEKISVDHSENIKMLNFWDGTRDVYGLNRSGKSMILTGSEYQSDTCDKSCPCEHIACVRAMGKDGSTIEISELRSLFNGSYKIRSFGWKHISEKPEVYEWILELEDTN